MQGTLTILKLKNKESKDIRSGTKGINLLKTLLAIDKLETKQE